MTTREGAITGPRSDIEESAARARGTVEDTGDRRAVPGGDPRHDRNGDHSDGVTAVVGGVTAGMRSGSPDGLRVGPSDTGTDPDTDAGAAADAPDPDADADSAADADSDTDADTAAPRLTVSAVASRLGVAPSTLRTWDRRYGLGPSEHTSGRHRRYDADDIARLEIMQRALLRGASPAEAARFALSASVPAIAAAGADGAGGSAPGDPFRSPRTGDGRDPGAGSLLLAGAEPEGERPRGGGRGLKLPGASRTARGLGRAVLALDSVAVHRLLADSLTADGVAVTWNAVVRPVLAALAERWETSGTAVEAGHLLRECAMVAFNRLVPPVPVARNPRPALLACVPDEQHSLPLYALSTVLAEREVGVRMFGAALPSAALAAAIKRIGPAAVLLWAQLPRNASPELFAELPRIRQRVRILVAGPGWHPVELPSKIEFVDSLTAAADRIEEITCGARPASA